MNKNPISTLFQSSIVRFLMYYYNFDIDIFLFIKMKFQNTMVHHTRIARLKKRSKKKEKLTKRSLQLRKLIQSLYRIRSPIVDSLSADLVVDYLKHKGKIRILQVAVKLLFQFVNVSMCLSRI